MLDGTTKEVTLRPTVDVEGEYSYELYKQREKALRKKIRVNRALTQQTRIYRELQWQIMLTNESCTKKEAKAWSEDPDPYDKSYVFYCLKIED